MKMQQNREAQEESLRRREELIQELEMERETRNQEKEQEEGRRTARMKEIDAQVGMHVSPFISYCFTLLEAFKIRGHNAVLG